MNRRKFLWLSLLAPVAALFGIKPSLLVLDRSDGLNPSEQKWFTLEELANLSAGTTGSDFCAILQQENLILRDIKWIKVDNGKEKK